MATGAPTPVDKAKHGAAKKEVMQAVARKRHLDAQVAKHESKLYHLETTYLTETAVHAGGNVIHGFEGYLKNQPGGRRKYEITDGDRIFSMSSLTFRKLLELVGDGEESGTTAGDESRMSTPGRTTVILPSASKTQELQTAALNKNRDHDYQRKKRAAQQQQSTGTPMSDDESVSGRKPSKRARLADDD